MSAPKKPSAERVQETADMLNSLPPEARDKILANVGREDPLLAIELEKRFFMFEHLERREDAELQQLLRGVDIDELALALRGVSDSLRDKILNNMTVRQATTVRDRVEELGPQPASLVAEARQAIVAKAKALFE
jgi:flagellar motor switch protein FliG